MSKSVETPWKPATRTMRSESSASWIRCARTSTIFAFPWTVSVTIPACDPVSEIASRPRSAIAIATRAQEMRSPTEMSMSISLGFGCGETSWARETSSSVCWPIAETTATTRFPARLASTRREATRRIFSGSATEVPPNFMTRVPAAAGGSAGSTAGTGSKVVSLIAGSKVSYIGRRPERALPRVTSSAYSRSPPTGRPLASRVTRTRSRSRSAR